jgi:hypothetical protein
MTAEEIIAAVEAVGGRIWLHDGLLHSRLPRRERSEGGLLPELRRRRDEVLYYLTENDPLAVCPVHSVRATSWRCQDGYAVCGLCHPDPLALAVTQSQQSGPPAMPTGVRLLAWELKQPPVELRICSVVTNPFGFITSTLRQLDAALRGNSWAAGNWTVRDLCERLEQVGVHLRIVEE